MHEQSIVRALPRGASHWETTLTTRRLEEYRAAVHNFTNALSTGAIHNVIASPRNRIAAYLNRSSL